MMKKDPTDNLCSLNFIYKTYSLKSVILVQGTVTGVSLLHRLFVFFVAGVLQQVLCE